MTPTLNPDGVSIKGCKYIYAPKGQAGEYAPLAANPYRGCGHKCAYCYVPLVTKQPRAEFDAGAVLRKDFIRNLTQDAVKYEAAGLKGQVMLSFTTDPYHPGDNRPTRDALEILRRHGMGFCTLTKGGTRALRDIDLFRPTRDAFACTLTSIDIDFSKKWERGAADPLDRIKALQAFHDKGIFTWVSLEPTLDVDSSIEVVRATHEFVDLFKIGRANYVPTITNVVDWRDYALRMLELVTRLDCKYYFKKDLQPHLPHDTFNPPRIEQHH